MKLMIPFHFQKGNKEAGCEDAPPIAKEMYSIVCDGLGGSGSTKYNVIDRETNTIVSRTSAYLGSRIVASCVENYYSENVDFLENILFPSNEGFKSIDVFIKDLKEKIVTDFETNISNYGVEPPASKALKVFPTTLASAIYFEKNKILKVLVIWAGDSRVYKLSPSKGLQLLSVDDADMADESMNSASAMNNCISARNQFHLNYTVYDINEPCILFSCSDGCFDYMQSPLHFEWLLLNTILDYMPEDNSYNLGMNLANTIKKFVYNSIGDDTTMAGVCYGIDNVKSIKQLYQNRMKTFGQSAVNMNDCLKNLKDIQDKRDSASKICRIHEGKIQDSIQEEIYRTLRNKTPNSLYVFIKSLVCYGQYVNAESKIDETAQKGCDETLYKFKTVIEKDKKKCMKLMMYDYMKWQRIQDELCIGGNIFYKRQVVHNLYGNEKRLSNKMYANPLGSIQVLETFLKMYNRPEIIKYVEKKHCYDEINDVIGEQLNAIHNMINLITESDDTLTDIWSQSYFSTEKFEDDYNQIKNDMSMQIMLENALKEPSKCQFLSSVTLQNIAEHNKKINEMLTIKKKYELEAKQQKNDLPKTFYKKNEQEILDSLFNQPLNVLLKLFEGTSINIGNLKKIKEAKDELNKTETDIISAQKKVDLIWNSYRFNYELYKLVRVKGVI